MLRVFCRTAALCLAAVGIASPASAQPRHARSPAAAWTGANVVRVYVEDETAPPELAVPPIPSNLALVPEYRDRVISMLGASPTFRRQCARIANARHLSVSVAFGGSPGTTGDPASTRIVFKPDGTIQADVRIAPLADLDELVAHEFEHILEQLDGVDLAAMARRADTGVRAIEGGERFETARAIAAGRQVAQEVRRARRRGGA